jgi:flagellar hook-basal body complex protein FliE
MAMNIGGPLSGLPLPQLPTSGNKPAAPAADFGSMLNDAVGALGALGAKADASTAQLATGAPIDIHEVMLNTEQASMGFSLALQVRNKLVDAYQEIMRMSV